ncbi:MAG: hypothetical protein AB1756_01685 [Acidobacteriota bacterium]
MGFAASRRKEWLTGGALAMIGFLLSPVSWWNDVFINIPVSWLLASLISTVMPLNFSFLIIFCYWLTNFAGILLMYIGSRKALSKKLSVREIFLSLVAALGYTFLLILLIWLGVIKEIKW